MKYLRLKQNLMLLSVLLCQVFCVCQLTNMKTCIDLAEISLSTACVTDSKVHDDAHGSARTSLPSSEDGLEDKLACLLLENSRLKTSNEGLEFHH